MKYSRSQAKAGKIPRELTSQVGKPIKSGVTRIELGNILGKLKLISLVQLVTR